jgi:hypothetical protein
VKFEGDQAPGIPERDYTLVNESGLNVYDFDIIVRL